MKLNSWHLILSVAELLPLPNIPVIFVHAVYIPLMGELYLIAIHDTKAPEPRAGVGQLPVSFFFPLQADVFPSSVAANTTSFNTGCDPSLKTPWSPPQTARSSISSVKALQHPLWCLLFLPSPLSPSPELLIRSLTPKSGTAKRSSMGDKQAQHREPGPVASQPPPCTNVAALHGTSRLGNGNPAFATC